MRGALLGCLGSVWRRFTWGLQKWPYRLARAYDQEQPQATKMAIAREFLASELCCLDRGMGRPLRQKCLTLDDLLSTDTVAFMETAFKKLHVTTTFLETQFAKLRQWQLPLQKPLSVATLAAKHMVHAFEANHPRRQESIRKRVHNTHTKRKQRRAHRPVWATRSGKVNGIHLFTHQHKLSIAEGQRQFKRLPPEEKQIWSSRAQSANAEKKLIRSAVVESQTQKVENDGVASTGAWGLGNEDFPLSPRVLAHLGFEQKVGWINSHAKEWRKGCERCGSAESLPRTKRSQKATCSETLPACRTIVFSQENNDRRRAYQQLKDDLRLVLLQLTEEKSNRHLQPVLTIRPQSGSSNSGHVEIFQCANLSRSPFACELLRYKVEVYEGTLQRGQHLHLIEGQADVLPFETELGFCWRLASEYKDCSWVFHHVICGMPIEQTPVDFRVLQIVDVLPLDLAARKAELQSLAAAKHLLRTTLSMHNNPSKRRPSSAGSCVILKLAMATLGSSSSVSVGCGGYMD